VAGKRLDLAIGRCQPQPTCRPPGHQLPQGACLTVATPGGNQRDATLPCTGQEPLQPRTGDDA
jgi:hypothetical protein